LATAQFFVVQTHWHHEFQSLSSSGFDARYERRDGNWTWHPNRAGLDFFAAEGVAVPGSSAGQRLRQMKAIAERFTAAVDSSAAGTFESPEQLRLLTTPVYRYSAIDEGILDGAMFAFVQGTNPEVLLLIEALDQESNQGAWRYGFARMSCFRLRVRRDEATVMEWEREPVPTPDRTSPYYFRLRAELDRSADVEIRRAGDKKN
jgi:hypothetical protein